MKIIGYLNQNGYYPSPLIVIGQEGEKLYGKFPAGAPYEVKGFESLEKDAAGFVREDQDLSCEGEQYAYAIDPDTVIIDEPGEMYFHLRKVVNRLHKNSLKKIIMLDYLDAIKEDRPVLNWENYIGTLKTHQNLRVLLHDRVTKKSRKIAPRLILQVSKCGSYKTFYKKNFHYKIQDVRTLQFKKHLLPENNTHLPYAAI